MTDLPAPPPSATPPPPPSGFGAPPPPGYSDYGAPAPTAAYAGFGARFGAYLLDGLIFSLFFIPAIIALVAGPTEITRCSVDNSGNITIGEELNALCEGPTGGTIGMAVLLGLAAFVAILVIEIKLLGGPRGATWGKQALGIKVVDATTGGPIGSGRALGRILFQAFISPFLFYLGFLWMLWDARKQTWHDKVVTSIVVKA